MDAYSASVSKKIAEGKLLTGIIMELQYDLENYWEEGNRDKKMDAPVLSDLSDDVQEEYKVKLKTLSEQVTRILRALDVLTTAAGFEDPLTADNRLAIRNAETEMLLRQREVLRISAFWETHDIKFPL